MDDGVKYSISKIDAARRQLDTAIELWFMEKDAVSIHTLAYAAYQVIHDVNVHLKTAHETLFETSLIKEEHRKDWNKLVRKAANFFKHGDNDSDGAIEFTPASNLMFLMYGVSGLGFLLPVYGGISSPQERIFALWLVVQKPNFVTAGFLQHIRKTVSPHDIERLRVLSKPEFYQMLMNAAVKLGQSGPAAS